MRRCLGRALLALLTGMTILPAPLRAAGGALEPNVVIVVLNSAAVSTGELVYTDPDAPQGAVWVKLASLDEWRLLADTPETRRFEGVTYARLCAPNGAGTLPGLTCFYDDSSAQLTLTAEARRIVALRIEAPRNAAAAPTDARSLGAYANYELFGTAGRATLLGVASEAHAFTLWGDGYLTLAGLLADGRSRSTTRLAGWQWDMPLRGTSLAVGGVRGGDCCRVRPAGGGVVVLVVDGDSEGVGGGYNEQRADYGGVERAWMKRAER